MPKDGTAKQSLHAFRVDRELTEFLSTVPNKTEFIIRALRNAIAAEKKVTCPMCNGDGQIFRPRIDKAS